MSAIELILPQSREERLQYIRQVFPHATGKSLPDKFAGGRSVALSKLYEIDPITYANTRNYLDGTVTHLSPYLRHGCISLKEALDYVYGRFGLYAEKLIREFAWRDYWRKVWYQQGDAIFSEMDAPKVMLGDKPLNDAIKLGNTGLPCIDSFVDELLDTGYLHNHARMWFAAYLVHWLKVDWRIAADWFENQLIDGDKASNHLSWQWVASSFSSKPYFFNKENIKHYSHNAHCETCHVKCPFNLSYEALNLSLFKPTSLAAKIYPTSMPTNRDASLHNTNAVFVHDEMLSVDCKLMDKSIPHFFIFDEKLHGNWPLKRLQFVADCLAEMPNVEVWAGDTYDILNARGVGNVITQNTPNQLLKSILEPFNPVWVAEPVFTKVALSSQRLKRFSRYWEKVGPDIFGADYQKEKAYMNQIFNKF